MKLLGVAIISILLLVLTAGQSSAFMFNGTVSDTNGTALNNVTINITIYSMTGGGPPTLIGSNSTTSNATGDFNLTVTENTAWFYKPVITHNDTTNDFIDFVGQSLPAFPYAEFSGLSDVNFYLEEAGTINITVINKTGNNIAFGYMIKDTRLGYEVSMSTSASSLGVVVNMPKDRNYSIMVWPASGDDDNHFVPVSFDWNNFSSANDYTINATTGSRYNATTKTLHKGFNVTESFAWISGYINDSTITDGWGNFTVVPFVLEPSGMIFMNMGGMPFNASRWRPGSFGDNYNLSSGFYNITVPYATGETVRYILFAAAQNGTQYRGGYRAITVTGDNDTVNFTMYGLLGNAGHYTMSDSMGGSARNVPVRNQTFNLINSSGEIIQGMNAHIEVKVDYSDYGAMEFTLMEDISSAAGTIYLPLLDVTGIKEMNIFTTDYAPKKTKLSAAQIQANNNITLSTFGPGEIPGGADISMGDITVSMYRSNSTCDVPAPPGGCLLTSSAGSAFSPLSVVIGGGELSLRMSYNNITVHYKNVDLLASGPPDAMFDGSANESESGAGLEAAWRFGSAGPEIYDEVLIGIPYAATVDETASFSILLNNLYNEDWNSVWNTTDNPSAENYTTTADGDYADFNQSWFNRTAGGMNCSLSNINADCFVNTSTNMIWLKIPHFSGIGPAVSTTTAGNVTLNTASADVNCTNNCTVYINVTNNNYTLSESLQNISINNTDSAGNIIWFKIYWMNATSDWILNGTNSSQHSNYNFTLSNGSASTIHQYKVVVNKTNVTTTQWNFTYNVSGASASLLRLSINLNCTESWSYSSWTACSGTAQTRTATDANSCGTTVYRAALSQTCSSDDETIGGGDTPTPTSALSKSWTNIIAGYEAVMAIDNAAVALTQIKFTLIAEKTSVDMAVVALSAKPSTIADAPGNAYKYFSITTTNIEESNVQSAKINFRINNTWISDNRINMNNVSLYRYASSQWNKLATVFVSRDSTYTHYEAGSPGFSTFAVTGEKLADATICTAYEKRCMGDDLEQCGSNETAWGKLETCVYGCNETTLVCNIAPEGLRVCTPGEKRCVGDTLQECKLDASVWVAMEACAQGCNETTLACNPAPAGPATPAGSLLDYWWIILIIIAAVVVVVVFLYMRTGAAKTGFFNGQGRS